MPRTTIDIDFEVEYLSILDEACQLDESLDPKLPEDMVLRMHEVMLLSRRFDERMLSMQRQGKLGTFALVKGQEAAQVGAIATLKATDWMVPSYRETAVAVWRGTPLEGMLLYNAGYNEGGRVPDEQCDLPIAIPVGSQMLHAAGLAYALKAQGKDSVVMTFFGDGATSQGDFHEALNFARVFECPVVFVCQNNHYAISVPRERQTKSKTLAQKAIAYDVPGIQVDGNDLLAVYVACREAVRQAREQRLPTLIECVTYRLSLHTTVDDPRKYRKDEEVELWQKREPLRRFQQYLKQRGLLSDEDLQALEARTEQRLVEAAKRAKQLMDQLDDPSVMFDHLFADMPRPLARQRQAFQARQQRRGRSQTERHTPEERATNLDRQGDAESDRARRNEGEDTNGEADHGTSAESGAA